MASPGASRREATRQEVAKRDGGARHRAASCAGTGRRQEKGGQVDWAAGGAGPGKWRQVGGPGGLLSLSIYFCSICFVLFNSFCHCFEFKIIQTMPKTPLNIFILLDGLFQKLIKYFRGI